MNSMRGDSFVNNNCYYSGLPYSDTLKHYGIKGQKWGVRRYQNADGTLTDEGRKRYRATAKSTSDYAKQTINGRVEGIKNAPRRLAQGIARGVKNKLAEKFPFMLNDEEISRYTDRMRLENQYQNARADKRMAKQRGQKDSFVSSLAKDVVRDAIKDSTRKVVNKAVDRALETKQEKQLRESKNQMQIYDNVAKSMVNRVNSQLSEDEADNISDLRELMNKQAKAMSIAKKLTALENKEAGTSSPADILKRKRYEQKLEKLNKESESITSRAEDRIKRLKETKDFIDTQKHSVYGSNSEKGGKSGLSDQDINRIIEKLKNMDSD